MSNDVNCIPRVCPVAYRSREMVGPPRPEFVLFGSSIVELSFGNDGWAANLAHTYRRKADITKRGYSGWNSEQGVQVYGQIFPRNATEQPALVIVYFGGNDAMEINPEMPPNPDFVDSHVPLDRYLENMGKIIAHLQSLSDTIRLIFLGCPPVDEERIYTHSGGYVIRSNEVLREYSEALLHLCKKMGVTGVDLWTAMQKREDWKTAYFLDGLHFNAEGSAIVLEEIMKAISTANWTPSLYWEDMPIEFA